MELENDDLNYESEPYFAQTNSEIKRITNSLDTLMDIESPVKSKRATSNFYIDINFE